jgi:hypothetical protein
MRLIVVQTLYIPLRVKKLVVALLPDDAPVGFALLSV